MKLLKFLTFFICSVMLVVNAHATTKSYNYSDVITNQGQIKSHQLYIPYSGTLKVTLTVRSGGGDYIVFFIKKSGTAVASGGTSGSISETISVSAGSSYTIELIAMNINSSHNYASYSVIGVLTYTPNSAPVISSMTATPASPVYGNSVTVNVSATDVDNNLSYVKFTKGSSSVNDTAAPYSQVYSGLAVGSHTVTAYAVDAKAASDDASVSFTVNKATATISKWPTASAITYGQALANSSLSNGAANIAGAFAWTSSGTKPPAGTRSYTVQFTPTDTTNYNSLTHSVSVTTNKANPSITVWPSASTITYPQTLASSSLSGGSANIAGSFAWTSSGTKPPAGTRGYTVRFTPTNSNYNSLTHSINVTTNKATPSITWPTSSFGYGIKLSSAPFTGGSSNVPGSFVWSSPNTIPAVGTHSFTLQFIPTDSANYNSQSASVSVYASSPSVTGWPTASQLIYGNKLSSSTLSGGSASVSGSFSWTSPNSIPLAGNQTAQVVFTPSNSNYSPVYKDIAVFVLDLNGDPDGDGLPYWLEASLAGAGLSTPSIQDSNNAIPSDALCPLNGGVVNLCPGQPLE